MGLSPALRQQLAAAEAELASLAPFSRPELAAKTIDASQLAARIGKVAPQLDAALGKDIPAAREVLARKIGEIKVEERDDGVYAQMDIGPVLLEAAEADVTGSGCGGRI